MINFFNKIRDQKNPWARIISALAIIFIVIPPIFLSHFAKTPGIYIGLIFVLFLAIWGLFEIFNNFASIYSAIFLSCLVFIVFLIDFNFFLELIRARKPEGLILKNQLRRSINWWAILIVALASLIPSIWDRKIRSQKNLLLNQFFITFIIVAVSIFAKMFWIISIDPKINSFYFLLFLILIPILNDTFSYLGGKYLSKYIFNKAKLSPRISPKKTWGGFIAGFVVTSLFIGLSAHFFHFFSKENGFSQETLMVVCFAFFLPIISTLGDLFFSLYKRYLGIKDFSNLIPGHGGIFDRLDAMSLVFVFVGLVLIFVG